MQGNELGMFLCGDEDGMECEFCGVTELFSAEETCEDLICSALYFGAEHALCGVIKAATKADLENLAESNLEEFKYVLSLKSYRELTFAAMKQRRTLLDLGISPNNIITVLSPISTYLNELLREITDYEAAHPGEVHCEA